MSDLNLSVSDAGESATGLSGSFVNPSTFSFIFVDTVLLSTSFLTLSAPPLLLFATSFLLFSASLVLGSISGIVSSFSGVLISMFESSFWSVRIIISISLGAWRLSRNATLCKAYPDEYFTRTLGLMALNQPRLRQPNR